MTIRFRLKTPELPIYGILTLYHFVIFLQNNPTPTQMNTPIRRPTRRPTKRPTKTPTSSPVQPPSVDLTLFVLGTVTFSTAGSTYNPTLFIGILQSILVFLFNGAYLNLINNVSIKLLSVISRTPTQADTTSQVTTFEFTILVPTLDLDELPDSPDYDDFIIDTTEDFINFFGLTITTALFQNFVFGALSSAQNSFTSVNTVTFDPVEFPPTPA